MAKLLARRKSVKRKATILFEASILVMMSSGAFGADSDCTGTITSLSLQLNNSGTVVLSLSGGPSYVYLCNIDGTVINGVSNEVCKAMYSTLMAAKLADKKVMIRFYGHATCAAIPSWGYPGNLGWNQVLID